MSGLAWLGALAMTALLMWAGAEPAAGAAFEGWLHWVAHPAAFAVLTWAWQAALPRASPWMTVLGVALFAVGHEAYEVRAHVHAFEGIDVLLDLLGAGLAWIVPVRRRTVEPDGLRP